MALGEKICDYRGKITSMKVLPFDDGSPEVKYEVTQVLTLTGKLAGSGLGSNYVRQAADGTSVTRFYGLFTTDTGENLRAEFAGNAVAIGNGRARFRTTGILKAPSKDLQWLTDKPLAFEGEGDFGTMEVSGSLYLWS